MTDGLFDTIKQAMGMDTKKSVDIHVEICPEEFTDQLIEANDSEGIERWLYAGTPRGSERIWLLKGEADEPYTDDAKERRVYDAVNHETMHAVISHIESEDVSSQYDDLIKEGLPVTTYLHRYAQFTDAEMELARMDEEVHQYGGDD